MLSCYPSTTSEPDRAGIYHAGLAGAARCQFMGGQFHREQPMERGRCSGEQAPVSQERAIAGDQGDVRVDRPGPQALHILLVRADSQAHLWRHRFRWTERRLSDRLQLPFRIVARDNWHEPSLSNQARITLCSICPFPKRCLEKILTTVNLLIVVTAEYHYSRRASSLVIVNVPATEVFAPSSNSSSRSVAGDARSTRPVSSSQTPRLHRNK